MIRSAVTILVVVFLAWFLWTWGFCRLYVRPGHMAVLVAKGGESLPEGQILARKGQRGIQEEVLGEGRHFYNPYRFTREIHPVLMVPPGKMGIVTSKVGTNLPPGEFLANPGQKGILRSVLGPGTYRLNPYGYTVEVVDALSIPVGYVGVITSLAGQEAPAGQFAAKNQQGVRRDILQPGLYYVNPKEFKIDVLEVGVNQVSLLGAKGSAVITKRQLATQTTATDDLQRNVLQQQRVQRDEYLAQSAAQSASGWETAAEAVSSVMGRGKTAPAAKKAKAPPAPPKPQAADSLATFSLAQFVEFPSRDGFEISVDMTVEFEFTPQDIASIFRDYGDMPAVVDKIILPQILSVSRLKGSAYRARDFIAGEGREKFQNDLTEALSLVLRDKRIAINNALIRHVQVPMQILDPIQQRSIAVEQDFTNREMQNTARRLADLNTQLGLIEQRRQQTAQETEKIRAEVKAEQEKEVAELGAEAMRRTSEIARDTAELRAGRTKILGQAEASVVTLVEGEKAKGHLLKTKAFQDPNAYVLWEFASHLSESLGVTILHAGNGTLWTDLDNPRLGDLNAAAHLQGPDKAASGTPAKGK